MAYLDMDGLTHYDGLIKAEISGKIDVGSKAGGIPYGNVDSTSTSTKFTATVESLTELYDGACVMLHNGVVTSAKNFTINVNGLGAKKCYSNMTNATQETTIFNANYTLMFVYSTALDSGNGGWWVYRGYDSNTTYTPVKLGFGYGHCTTAAATAAKAVAISGYVLNTGGIVSVLFDHDVQAGATLNVTSKGAKAIYYNGAAIANGIIKAGDTATFMYSGQYHLLSIDRWGSDIDGKQPTLVSGTSIKTINGESILGSGNIATPTYTLPEATTSTLGGVKVDGTTITANDGVISAVGGGGGGGSTLTLYTNDTNLYVDSALATSLLESVDYDYDAAMSMLKNAGKVIVEWPNATNSEARYAVVCGAYYDTIDETFNVALIRVSSIAQMVHINCS